MNGVTVAWDNDQKTIICYDFHGRWTWEDFYASTAQAFAMTRSVTHRVDTISHFRHGTVMPPNAMFHFREAMVNAPKNRGVNVIVGGTIFVRTLVKMFSRINKNLADRLVIADSMDEARMLLAVRRQ
jgi:hypothetical protein